MAVSKRKPKVRPVEEVVESVDNSVEKVEEPVVDKKKELQNLADSLNKKFSEVDGEKVITLGFPAYVDKTVKRIPTGSFSLDIALGGGLPLGRYIEISGDFSSTKTTQALHMLREAQKAGLTCAYIDVEGTTDENYAESLGVDVDSLLYTRPDSLEEATQIVLDLQRSQQVQFAVLDSIAAMTPNKEQDKNMNENMQMGIPQKLLSEFFRKYQANNNRLSRRGANDFTLIGINQIREKIGVMFGDTTYTPGGRAKGFTASVDLRLRRGDWISEGTGSNKEIVGQVVKFKIEKNKTYKRMQTGEFDFYFSENEAGIPEGFNDNMKEVILNAVLYDVIKRKGAYYTYGDLQFKGSANLIETLKNDTALVEDLKKEVMRVAFLRNE